MGDFFLGGVCFVFFRTSCFLENVPLISDSADRTVRSVRGSGEKKKCGGGRKKELGEAALSQIIYLRGINREAYRMERI